MLLFQLGERLLPLESAVDSVKSGYDVGEEGVGAAPVLLVFQLVSAALEIAEEEIRRSLSLLRATIESTAPTS